MLMKDRFKTLSSNVAKIKRIAEDGDNKYWNLLDSEGELIGHGFYLVVPDSPPDLDEIEEFDKYEVTGIVDTNFEITNLDISEHPEGPDDFWAAEIMEPEYANQYLGLKHHEMILSTQNETGRIDSVSDGTLSSISINEAIRNKLKEIERLAG